MLRSAQNDSLGTAGGLGMTNKKSFRNDNSAPDAQILPFRIHRLDQRDFAFPQPAFNRLFASYSQANIAEQFVIDELLRVVAGCESGHEFSLMLFDAPLQIIRYTRVEDARFAGHNVDAVALHG